MAAELIERKTFAPRVLVLSPDPGGTGGIERVSRTLIAALSDLCGPEQVGLLRVWGGSAQIESCRLLFEGPRPRQDPPGHVPLATRLAFGLRSVRAARSWRHPGLAIVACHASLGPVAWLAARTVHAPYAIWCHGNESWGGLELPVRFALRHADAVFAPSAFTARAAENAAGLPKAAVRVIPHCLPPDWMPAHKAETGHQTVLAVSRLAPRDIYKGVDTLLYAWPRVKNHVPTGQLVIVGDGPDRPRLERIADVLGLTGSVAFAGRVSDDELKRFYSEATVFALPGRHTMGPRPQGEGFGLVFIEAAAAGVPVVAGKGGSTEEVVADGRTGILVNPSDTSEVAAAVVRLLTEPLISAAMGEAARERTARDFSYGSFKAAIRALVGELVHAEADPACVES